MIRTCSYLRDHRGVLLTGLALLSMASSAPSPAWGQSAVWLPQGATTGNIYYNGGNVGIGTTVPGYPLTVIGSTLSNGRVFSTGDGSYPSSGQAVGMFWFPSYGAGVLSAYDYGTNTTKPLLLNPGGGNVGIGTTNPQHKLAVNGTIQTKEVIVDTGWSDYVFNPRYRLKPLTEISAYIGKHHHLPDLPSESEVKAKGVSVGEMQAKLLAKIEELTLHMIEADKRIATLERQNAELRHTESEPKP